MTKSVCIIGAGPSGLAQLRAFQSAAERARKFLRSFAMKSNRIGALFGDILGERVSMSTEIRVMVPCISICGLNGPKEGLEFADYTFEEHFGKPIASAELGTELEIGQLDGLQKRLKAKIVPFPHFDPQKQRVKGIYEDA